MLRQNEQSQAWQRMASTREELLEAIKMIKTQPKKQLECKQGGYSESKR